MPGFSPLEAMRAGFAVIVACIVSVAFWRAPDGRMAFASPIRRRMVRVRRIQMAIYFSVALVWFGQAMSAATVESPWPPSWAAIVQTFAVSYTVLSLAFVAVYQYKKWSDFERIIGDMPLIPDIDDAGIQASIESRPIMHEINGKLTHLLGRLYELRHDTILSNDARSKLDEIDAELDAIIRLHGQAQTLIQAVSKEMIGSTEL